MGEVLSAAYPWVKALHVMAVLSWMAGLFYLPRLYVYHVERGRSGVEPGASFALMEAKLLRVIMNPAAVVAWAAGLALVFTPGIVDWSLVWPWTKAAGVAGMTWFHLWLRTQAGLIAGGGGLTGPGYRLMNEVPTVLMIVIVLSVIVRF